MRSVLVDFDGTASAHDVAEHLMEAFGAPDWQRWDEVWARGEIDTRTAIRAQVAPFRATEDELVAFALAHCSLDPTFVPFVTWCRERELEVTIVSDGLGLYVEPMLRAAGVEDLAVITNTWDGGRLSFPNGHPECIRCGTCKMLAVQRARGPVAFVGEGSSDRYGALYADVVFAKDALVEHCVQDGVPYVAWKDFDDVRRWLDAARELPGAVAPLRCPGWMPPT